MITQEMVEAVIDSVTLSKDEFGEEVLLSVTEAKDILKAVYPLIIEQAAEVCDKYTFADNAASGIRNLKDKTDEAHNG